MSRKVAVYGLSGSPEGGHVKNSEAKRLVRQMFAVWLERNVSIQRVSVRQFRPSSAPQLLPPRLPYIPEVLPPIEIPGVRFLPPASLISWYPGLEL